MLHANQSSDAFGNQFGKMVGQSFNFEQQWYPLCPVKDLDNSRPTAVTLLGRRLVIWKPRRDADQYCVMLDSCPHRLAPLSEGRVDEATGQLMCSFHGWQFDSQGKCVHIPQAEDPAKVIRKTQPCTQTLPCQVKTGLLWVWADEKSADKAFAKSLPLSCRASQEKDYVWPSFMRDLPYDWFSLIEHILDLSHAPFSHHGVPLNRALGRSINRSMGSPLQLKVLQSTPTMLEFQLLNATNTRIFFEPPCRIEFSRSFSRGRKTGQVVYCVPVALGRSRIISLFPRNFERTTHYLTPRWLDHLVRRNQILDGDIVLLHHQERNLQQYSSSGRWKTVYNVPTGADRIVIELHNWFERNCRGRLPWDKPGTLLPEDTAMTRQVLLNRYHQHTQICGSCRSALKVIKRLQIALLSFFAIAVLVIAEFLDSLPAPCNLFLGGLAALALLGYGWLKYWLEPKFYYVDYVHASKK